MFLISRLLKIEKGKSEQLYSKYLKEGIVDKFDGFIKLDVLLNTKNKEYDRLVVNVYWEDRDAFLRFERSPEHINSHKNQGEKPKEILEFKFEEYELVGSKNKK